MLKSIGISALKFRMKSVRLSMVLCIIIVFSKNLRADRIYWGAGNWGDVNYIKSCNTDGSDVTVVQQLDTGFYGAMDVDVNKTEATIYWASPLGMIEKCHLAGSGYERITSIINAWISNIFVNEANSKIYFTDSNIIDALCRIDLDGSNLTQIINEYIVCFDIDPMQNKIYYVTLYKYIPHYDNQAGRIWQANLDGTNAMIIFGCRFDFTLGV